MELKTGGGSSCLCTSVDQHTESLRGGWSVTAWRGGSTSAWNVLTQLLFLNAGGRNLLAVLLITGDGIVQPVADGKCWPGEINKHFPFGFPLPHPVFRKDP